MELDLVLQAGSTFWFDYKPNPPARHIYIGAPFAIRSEDYHLYALMAREVLEGRLPEPKAKTFVERVASKVKEVLRLEKPQDLPVEPPPQVDSDTRYPCPHCPTVFKFLQGLEIHLRNAHPAPEAEPETSPEDDQSSEPTSPTTEEDAEPEEDPVEEEPEEAAVEEIAEEAALEPELEVDHQDTPDEPTAQKHQCPHCPRAFGSERGLQIHIGHIHENHNLFPEE